MDNEPPKIKGCPTYDIVVKTNGSATAIADWNNVTATDNSQANPEVKVYISKSDFVHLYSSSITLWKNILSLLLNGFLNFSDRFDSESCCY